MKVGAKIVEEASRETCTLSDERARKKRKGREGKRVRNAIATAMPLPVHQTSLNIAVHLTRVALATSQVKSTTTIN